MQGFKIRLSFAHNDMNKQSTVNINEASIGIKPIDKVEENHQCRILSHISS